MESNSMMRVVFLLICNVWILSNAAGLGETCTATADCSTITHSKCDKTCTCIQNYVSEGAVCKIGTGQPCNPVTTVTTPSTTAKPIVTTTPAPMTKAPVAAQGQADQNGKRKRRGTRAITAAPLVGVCVTNAECIGNKCVCKTGFTGDLCVPGGSSDKPHLTFGLFLPVIWLFIRSFCM